MTLASNNSELLTIYGISKIKHCLSSCAACLLHEDAKAALERALQEERQAREMMNTIHDPINRLPFEIASHVLGCCLPPTLSHEHTSKWLSTHPAQQGEGHSFQFTLGAVCRHWRQVIWSNPVFWCLLGHLKISRKTSLVNVSMVKEWLGRTGNLPLTVYLSCPLMLDEPTIRGSRSYNLVEAVFTVAHRWWSVYISLPTAIVSDIRIVTPQPYLQSLYLRISDRIRGNVSFELCEPSALELVQAYGMPLEKPGIRWEMIKHFHHGGFRKFLPFTLPTLQPIPVTNYSVQHLETTCMSQEIWRALTLPALEELYFESRASFGFGSAAADFMRRSQCPLKRLYIGDTLKNNDIPSFLKLTPSLEELECYCESDPRSTILELLDETLKAPSTCAGEQFLPNLRKLHVNSQRGLVPWPSIASIACQMTTRGDALRRLLKTMVVYVKYRFTNEANFQEEDIDADSLRNILHLIDSGMDIKVHNSNGVDMIEMWIGYYLHKGGDYEWLKSYRREGR
ncbi:hypothetical protein CPB83DRAFT_907720 [Crepidotus variabilis]|uniref:F-box domain-containing protein n=1 Tax=Crepidotus variabilis TaxID=179855 RepID=A0A9P6JNN0_9AGAR|nr:hypothetical protein CPB83DRAFT_907720 [Crepidotus variabilis]